MPRRIDYASAGVDASAEEAALDALAARVRRTFALGGKPGETGAVRLDLGHFANVIEITPELGLAVSTDGVGTKLLVAQLVGRYDTVGIDCVAMNVNDVICVGARPLTMLDYIAVERVDAEMLDALAAGLEAGAEAAGISIAGGELAQVSEMVRGARPGTGFDLVGTAVGLVPLDRIIVGEDLVAGDLVIGLTSTGIHSNGLSLARKALFEVGGYDAEAELPELGRALGAELLEPTRIYVKPVMALLDAVPDVKALAHITGDGLLNLLRMESEVGFEIDDPPEPPAVFGLIQETAEIEDAEMYRVFNMGVGFCAVVAAGSADAALAALHGAGADDARVIGSVRGEPAGTVRLPGPGLVGTRETGFEPET